MNNIINTIMNILRSFSRSGNGFQPNSLGFNRPRFSMTGMFISAFITIFSCCIILCVVAYVYIQIKQSF